MAIVIETTLGDFTVDLYVKERPQTCLNFVKLCKMKYYNLNLFHSITSNFCAQTGDPTGQGDGGESIHGLINGPDHRFFQGDAQPKMKHDRAGLLSMVSHGDRLLGSQFVITLSADLASLDNEHLVFGEIVEGHEVLLKLNEAICDDGHRPYQDIRITHTVILEDPFPDPPGMDEPPASPLPPSTKDIAFSRIPADETVADTCTQEELDELVQAREAAARAAILEMIGDLPDADVAPPENVLFVCKLNPVTTDHDLSIIFSRFGKVKSCEVIRDAVSGDSLQYAFVEFEDQKSCEAAYFKMDNVLIDDRRIHVDFSQSVAKWRGKGKGVEMLGPTPKGGWGNKSRNYGQGNDRNAKGRENDHNARNRENERSARNYENDRNFRSNENERNVRNNENDRNVRSYENDRRHMYADDERKSRFEENNRRRNDVLTKSHQHQQVNSFKNNRNDGVVEKHFDKKVKNGSRRSSSPAKTKKTVKKDVEKRRKRRSSSSSSSSSSSESTSESETSESEPVKKKKRRKSEKVFVVVKAPKSKSSKKYVRSRNKGKKYESESDSDEKSAKKSRKKKPTRRRESSEDDSSDYKQRTKKSKKRGHSPENNEKARSKKKRKAVETSSDEESEEERSFKKKVKKRRNDSSSENDKRERKKKREIVKKRKYAKKRKAETTESDSSSSSV